MTGTNVAATLPPRGYRAPSPGGMSAGHARNIGGGGQNPMRGASSAGSRQVAPEFDAQGHELEQPIEGLTSLVFHPLNESIRERRNAQIDTASEAQQGKIQAGVDAYMQQLNKIGDPQQALFQVFHPDNEGHVHFADPPTFQSILQMHQIMSGAQAPTMPNVVQLPGNLVAVNTPDGKWSVHPAKEMASEKPVKGPGGQYGTWAVNPDSGRADFIPGTVAGNEQQAPTAKVHPGTKAEGEQLNDIQTVLENTNKMKNAIGATGSFGFGSAMTALAAHSPLGGPQGEAYKQAYNDMAPALVRLSRSPGNAKLFGQLALERLPKPGEASDFLVNQALPGVALSAREQLGNLYTQYKGENNSLLPVATNLVKTYEAHPEQMQAIRQARDGLQRAPGQITDADMIILQHEAARDNLAYDDKISVLKQMAQRGLIHTEDADKIAAGYPDVMQFKPQDIVAPQYAKPPPSRGIPQAQPIQPSQPVTSGGPPQVPSAAPVGPQSMANPLIPAAQAAEVPGQQEPAQDQPQQGMNAQEMQPSGETASASAPLPPLGGAPANAQQQTDLSMAQQAMQGPNADELARQSAAQHLIEQAQQLGAPTPQGQ